MGACLSFCCYCCRKDYTRLQDEPPSLDGARDGKLKSISRKKTKVANNELDIEAFASRQLPGDVDFDMSLPVFAGIVVDQKYSTYSYYDKKYIWVCPTTRTLHMSQYETKDRRHKEANLSDILSMESVLPEKFKKSSPEDADLNAALDLYISIKFGRGGGVDFRFRNTSEKNEFMKYLQIVTNISKATR